MATTLGAMFLQGGWVMWPLLIFSVLTWAVILERTYVFLTVRPKVSRTASALITSMKNGDISTARQICATEKPQIAEIFLSAIDQKKSKEYAERVTERNRAKMSQYFKRNLWILGTIGSASPFVGLLGTVVGIVRAFHDMSEKGAGGFSVVAGGISEALVATAAGLVVAIIALLTYNIFVTAANNTVSGIRLTLEELIDLSFDSTSKAAS